MRKFINSLRRKKKVTGSVAVAGILDGLRDLLAGLSDNLAVADDEVDAQRTVVIVAKDRLAVLENIRTDGNALFQNLTALL